MSKRRLTRSARRPATPLKARRPKTRSSARQRELAVSAAVKKVNRLLAHRRDNAWLRWNEQQDRELSRAMNALAGYSHTSGLADLKAAARTDRRGLTATYDAASSRVDARHWANADTLGAMAANSPAVRAVLRKRARYEVANNCLGRGILLTKAYDLIGRGPRVQFDTGSPEANSILEAAFARWAKAAKLAQKLRTAVFAKMQDGEAFIQFTTNAGLRHPIKLDIRNIEADQVADPAATLPTANRVDGIVFDVDGNPVEYHLVSHPGESGVKQPMAGSPLPPVPADNMIHWFRADRPGQVRGIPEITPALPLFAQRRRFCQATLTAAEAAAAYAILIYTEMPPDGESAPVTPMSDFDIEHSMMTALPAGWKAGQMKAEHPATTYGMYTTALAAEIGRCINMPRGIALADSSDYNFASGRLDLLPYRKSLEIEDAEIEGDGLDRLIAKWLDEALAYYGIRYPVVAILNQADIAWSYCWDTVGYGVNPVDEANARRIDLESGNISRQTLAERANLDWEAEDERAAKGYGMTVEEYRRRLGEKLLAGGSRTQAEPQPEPPARQTRQQQEEEAAQQHAANRKRRQSNAA